MSRAEAKRCHAERAPCPLAPHLSVAQHWVSSLHSRHGQRETFQSPQEAAEVIVATHGCCQGLLTCAGVLRRRAQSGDQDPTEAPPNPTTATAAWDSAIEPAPPLLDTMGSAAWLRLQVLSTRYLIPPHRLLCNP